MTNACILCSSPFAPLSGRVCSPPLALLVHGLCVDRLPLLCGLVILSMCWHVLEAPASSKQEEEMPQKAEEKEEKKEEEKPVAVKGADESQGWTS